MKLEDQVNERVNERQKKIVSVVSSKSLLGAITSSASWGRVVWARCG